MTAYFAWKYLHILMFVFWVGTDMGVYLSCKKSTDPRLSIDARFLLLHMALRIELLPRTMWKAALPLGRDSGPRNGTDQLERLLDLPWYGCSVSSGGESACTAPGTTINPLGHKFAKVTNLITGIVGAATIALAISSYAWIRPIRCRRDLAALEDRDLRPDQSA